MAKLEKYGAPGVFDPPGYSQAVKVTGAQTILFLADEFFGARAPASTMIEVSGLAHPDYLIEIEAIAVV